STCLLETSAPGSGGASRPDSIDFAKAPRIDSAHLFTGFFRVLRGGKPMRIVRLAMSVGAMLLFFAAIPKAGAATLYGAGFTGPNVLVILYRHKPRKVDAAPVGVIGSPCF